MKGEFSTMIAFEKNDNKKKKIKEIYTKNRILEIKNLGKYYGAWGDIPYLVKLGGVKFNGIFLNTLKKIGVKNLDRNFYEDSIAKCILWESFYNIYGAGKKSIGQLRAPVIPYSIAAIYIHTDGIKDSSMFNFTKIWTEQKINGNFEVWAKELMTLMNNLIKKYSLSDNVEDGTKRKEIWESIKTSSELSDFFKLPNATLVLNDYKKNQNTKNKNKEIDFSELFVKIDVLNKGYEFYKHIKNEVVIKFIPDSVNRVTRMIDKFYMKKGSIIIPQEISYDDAFYIKELLIKINNNYNFDEIKLEESYDLIYCLNKIIEIHNTCMSTNSDIESEFKKYADIAETKNIPYAPSVLRKIGNKLKKGEIPSINDIYCASNHFNEKKNHNNINSEINSDNSINKNKLFYLKKIINQDLERTPTFSVEAIRDFFQIELNHGESKVINIQNALSGNIFKVEFKLRETRNEYRVFLNDLFKEIAPTEKEILIFSKVDDGNYLCEHVSIISSKYTDLDKEFELNKNHKLIQNII